MSTKQPTFKQVIKAVKDFAKQHGETYIQVEHHYNVQSDGSGGHYTFRAYINSFNTFSIADNIPDLIGHFIGKKDQPRAPLSDIDYDNLPF